MQIFQDVLSKSPPLEEVTLTYLDLWTIPAPIACLPGLKRVDLSRNKLTGKLCEGPWLDSLEELDLECNCFEQLPSALLRCKGRLRKSMLANMMGEGGGRSDQTKDIHQELVAAGTEVLLDKRARDRLRLAGS